MLGRMKSLRDTLKEAGEKPVKKAKTKVETKRVKKSKKAK